MTIGQVRRVALPRAVGVAFVIVCGAASGCASDVGGDGDGSGARSAGNAEGMAGGAGGPAGSVDMFGNSTAPANPAAMQPREPPKPNPEAFWSEDPPPMSCLEDGSMGPAPEPPGGTPDCPDDKHREGCGCTDVGEVVDCWPGLRKNRNRGVCRDGKTECVEYVEFGGAWGPCEGYRLPTEGATEGPEACTCFSQGRWAIENLSPCFMAYTTLAGGMETWAVSTFIGSDGSSGCPTNPGGPPPLPEPGTDWSPSSLTVDCEGRFELCYTLKAGDPMNPQPTDCSLARLCVETWYEQAGVTQELPPLPSWTSSDAACAGQFQATGGYGEMTVKGLSIECDPVDDGAGNEVVFNRVAYCPVICGMMPDLPECQNCMMGGSGDF